MIAHVYNGLKKRKIMSSIIYVVPWAICDTDNVYVKKVNADEKELPSKGDACEEWCIRNVIKNPDRRSKDVFAIVDVYNGFADSLNEKGMSVFSLTNSEDHLTELGYGKADDKERDFIKTKVLKAV